MPSYPRDDGVAGNALEERLESLAAWIGDLDARVRVAELASGDEKTAKELRKAVEALAKHDPKAQDRIRQHVDVLSDRVATLAGTVSTATAAVAGKDGEIAALRRQLDQATARMEALAAHAPTSAPPGELDELRQALSALASERETRSSDKQLAALADKIALVTERLDSVSSTVSTATASSAGREGELAALRRRLDEDGARLGAAVAELRQTIGPGPVLELRAAVESLARQASALEQETRRGLVALGVDVGGLGSRVGALDARLAELAERDAELAELRKLASRSCEQALVVEGELERARDEVAVLSARLDTLTGAVEGASPAADGPDGGELDALVSRFEEGAAKVDALVEDLWEALETMPSAAPTPACPRTSTGSSADSRRSPASCRALLETGAVAVDGDEALLPVAGPAACASSCARSTCASSTRKQPRGRAGTRCSCSSSGSRR